MGHEEKECKRMRKTTEAAQWLGLSPATLEAWRVRGGGPEFVKLGRAVRYSDEALDAFKARNTRTSTSQM